MSWIKKAGTLGYLSSLPEILRKHESQASCISCVNKAGSWRDLRVQTACENYGRRQNAAAFKSCQLTINTEGQPEFARQR